jgi:signal transduction histidine kinase
VSATTLLAILDPMVGAVLVVVGALVTWRLRRTGAGVLLLVAGLCWYAGAAVPAMVTLHRGPLAHLLITYPIGRTRRPTMLAAVAVGWLLAAMGGGPWPALLLAALLGATTTMRITQAAARSRHIITPGVVATAAFIAMLVVDGTNLLADLDADVPVAILYDIVVALLALALGADLWHAASTGDAVTDLVTGLSASPVAGGGVEAQLSRVLGDPGLRVGYWSAHRTRYVDQGGHDLDVEDGQASTAITDHGRPLAMVVHDPALSHDPGLLQAAVAAVRLTAANAVMRHEAQERVNRLSEARRRIVEAADVEGLALSRRLDEGPQERLRDVARALKEMERTSAPDAPTAQAVQRELDEAGHELRELAQGVRPQSLRDGGLAQAIPLLAGGCPVPTEVTTAVGRLDPTVEAGVYFFCAEGLANAAKHASAHNVRVTVRAGPSHVVAEVADDGVGGADPKGSGLRGLDDRITALGGTLEVIAAKPHGVRLHAHIPTGERQSGAARSRR